MKQSRRWWLWLWLWLRLCLAGWTTTMRPSAQVADLVPPSREPLALRRPTEDDGVIWVCSRLHLDDRRHCRAVVSCHVMRGNLVVC